MALPIDLKIQIPAEALELLRKKEARNRLISIGVGVAASATGFLVDRKLEMNLIKEFKPFVQTAAETVVQN